MVFSLVEFRYEEATLQLEHLQAVFAENLSNGDVFAMPGTVMSEYVIFKLVSLKPGNRMYLQRACSLSVDATCSESRHYILIVVLQVAFW